MRSTSHPTALSMICSGILVLALSTSPAAQASSCEVETLHNCFLVRTPPGLAQAVANGHALGIVKHVNPTLAPGLALATGPSSALPESVLAGLEDDPHVLQVELVTIASLAEDALVDGAVSGTLDSISLSGTFSGPELQYFSTSLWNGFADQPAMNAVNVDAAHLVPRDEAHGVGRVVAVIDTGVDPEHPLLQGALLPGWDFLLGQPGASEWSALDPATRDATKQNLQAAGDQSYTSVIEGGGVTYTKDSSTQVISDQSYTSVIEDENLPSGFGHGTMVAGIIRMVAPAAQILPLRVFNGDGKATIADIVEAVYWAHDNGASVINMSFSTDGQSDELLKALKTAKKAKVMTITSTGNSGSPALTYPAAYSETFGVASVDANGQLSAFSNYGDDVALLSAPGEGIVTAYPGGLYAGAWGTSFSAAFVSGTTALLHEINPDGTIQLSGHRHNMDALKKSAVHPDPANPNADIGAGVLDVHGAFGLGPIGY